MQCEDKEEVRNESHGTVSNGRTMTILRPHSFLAFDIISTGNLDSSTANTTKLHVTHRNLPVKVVDERECHGEARVRKNNANTNTFKIFCDLFDVWAPDQK
jgi:hypothetical protein